MPGRRSTPVRSIILLQRAVYRSELRIELRADALNCGDDRNAMPLATGKGSFGKSFSRLRKKAPITGFWQVRRDQGGLLTRIILGGAPLPRLRHGMAASSFGIRTRLQAARQA
jgi:hypothetical protein